MKTKQMKQISLGIKLNRMAAVVLNVAENKVSPTTKQTEITPSQASRDLQQAVAILTASSFILTHIHQLNTTNRKKMATKYYLVENETSNQWTRSEFHNNRKTNQPTDIWRNARYLNLTNTHTHFSHTHTYTHSHKHARLILYWRRWSLDDYIAKSDLVKPKKTTLTLTNQQSIIVRQKIQNREKMSKQKQD